MEIIYIKDIAGSKNTQFNSKKNLIYFLYRKKEYIAINNIYLNKKQINIIEIIDYDWIIKRLKNKLDQ